MMIYEALADLGVPVCHPPYKGAEETYITYQLLPRKYQRQAVFILNPLRVCRVGQHTGQKCQCALDPADPVERLKKIPVILVLHVGNDVHVAGEPVDPALKFIVDGVELGRLHQVSPNFPLIQATASAAVSTVSVSSSSSSVESSARNSPVVVGVLNWMFSPLVW
jgi:hypothetical protein